MSGVGEICCGGLLSVSAIGHSFQPPPDDAWGVTVKLFELQLTESHHVSTSKHGRSQLHIKQQELPQEEVRYVNCTPSNVALLIQLQVCSAPRALWASASSCCCSSTHTLFCMLLVLLSAQQARSTRMPSSGSRPCPTLSALVIWW